MTYDREKLTYPMVLSTYCQDSIMWELSFFFGDDLDMTANSFTLFSAFIYLPPVKQV